jgi:hypothetical protein
MYLLWFATRCGYTPDEVYDMPRSALVRFTLAADDQANPEARKAPVPPKPPRRMC